MRGMSSHTVHSYRDAIVLYMRFVAASEGIHPDEIDLDGFTAARVSAFVISLEE